MSNSSASDSTSILKLTPTEKTLLRNLSTGKTNKQLADLQGVSINTVKFHLTNIYEKLGVANRAAAVAFYKDQMKTLEAD